MTNRESFAIFWRRTIRRSMIGLGMSLAVASACAEEPSVGLLSPITSRNLDEGIYVLNQTFGGRQFWGDVQFFHDWHIQQNVFTGHYRLLDGQDRRHASGTLEECRQKLDEVRRKKKLPPMSGRAVILLHGIFRSSHSLRWFGEQLAEDGVLPITMDYPSTQVSIPEAAEYLHQVISHLDGIERIDLVTHSMGGLVVRAYLAKHADPRLHRLVMIATPNHGAEMADLLKRNWIFRGLFGPSGQQLSTEGLIATLPTPPFEFAVIAGARGTPTGWNRLIPGDDDGTVTVASTQLAGAVDFATVPTIHTFLIGEPEVVAMTRRFLNEGRLRAEGERRPIPRDQP
jgi:pimeloyl-ACP methyl ester carboxylesterase